MDTDTQKQIKALYDNIKENDEFEIIFDRSSDITYEKYYRILKYIKKLSVIEKNALQTIDTLDIIYTTNDKQENTHESHKITITDMEHINKYINMISTKNNHVIIKTISEFIDKDVHVTGQIKSKNEDDVVYIQEYCIKARVSREDKMNKKALNFLKDLDKTQRDKIIFRLKQRVSMYVSGIKIDLTMVKTTNNINNINNAQQNYELEIENVKKSKEAFEAIIKYTNVLLKLIQNSKHIISTTEITKVKEYVKTLTGRNDFSGANVISLEVQHVTDKLPNSYSVSDKADGDRHFLIVYETKVYLMDNNSNVKSTGMIVKKEYNGTIIDGELIFIGKYNAYLFLSFDCLFHKTVDTRSEPKLMNRLRKVEDFINNCYSYESHKYHKMHDTISKMTIDDKLKTHKNNITELLKSLNKDLETDKTNVLIRQKYFIDASGALPWELFAYSSLLYNVYTNKSECPYMLDGLIYQPLIQPYYAKNTMNKLDIYKWKPSHQNSIDFYVSFEKDKNTNKPLILYDNSYTTKTEENADSKIVEEEQEGLIAQNITYKICNLFVWDTDNKTSVPVPFKENEDMHYTYMPINKDGNVVDEYGNIITDKSVIECYYCGNINSPMSDKYRWTPIRTRHDKTEAVMKTGTKYGNNVHVANAIWRSIINPVTMGDIEELAKGGEIYENKMRSLKSRIGKNIIAAATVENLYAKITENVAVSMKRFVDWVKSNIVQTYYYVEYSNNVPQTVLDIGIGKGSDIMKYYNAKTGYVVCFDIDKQSIASATDGVQSRIEENKKRAKFTEIHAFQADAGVDLDFNMQSRTYIYTQEDRKIYDRFFGDKKVKFDRITCFFCLNNVIENQDRWSSFKTNINNHLKSGGYISLCIIDVEELIKLMNGKNSYTSHYTDDKGDKKVLFDIKTNIDMKTYNKNNINIGDAFEIHTSWTAGLDAESYVTEYMISKEQLIKDLSKDCNLELIDTDTFGNQYEMHKDTIVNYSRYNNKPTQESLSKVKQYYENNEMNTECLKYTRLQRYVIFRKRDYTMTTLKGGSNILNDKNTQIYKSRTGNNTFIESIHNVLNIHHLIPHSLSLSEFMKEHDIENYDNDLDMKSMKRIAKNIQIYHQNVSNNNVKKVVNGINIYLVADDTITIIGGNAKHNIIISQEDDKYHCVFKTRAKGLSGILSNKDELIIELSGK